MKKTLKYGLTLFVAVALCDGCKEAVSPAGQPQSRRPLEIEAEITGAELAESRTVKDEFDSYRSETGFSDGDQIGFYSMRDGNGDESNAPVNLPMTYTVAEKCFKNEALIVDYPNNFGYTFAYYPYAAENTDVIDIYKADGTVEDLLVAGTGRLSEGRIYLRFVHALSMVIFVPGTGFEIAAADAANEVRVFLREGLKACVTKDSEAGTIQLELTPDDTAPREFLARRRTDAMITVGGEAIPVCYSVILPAGAEIEHIEMTDNHGTVQQVVPQIEPLERSWRYPVRVEMTGTLPTVWPYEIQPWIDDGQPIELGGSFGIQTSEDLRNWVTLYNRYTSDNLPEDERERVVEQLKAFGEMTDGKWLFQLNADIDCEGLFGDDALTELVHRLNDTFDGRNRTLSNLTMPLIGTVGAEGRLADLNIDAITITSTTEAPLGAVAREMNGGAIVDCDIKNIRIETEGPVGAIAGRATAGTITGNRVNGLLLGASSDDDGITGSRSADVTCENNISSALIF